MEKKINLSVKRASNTISTTGKR